MANNLDWVKAVFRSALYSSWVGGVVVAIGAILIIVVAWATGDDVPPFQCGSMALCGQSTLLFIQLTAAIIAGGVPIMLAAAIYSVFLTFPCALLAGSILTFAARRHPAFWHILVWVAVGGGGGVAYWIALDYLSLIYFLDGRPPLGYHPGILLFPTLGGMAAAAYFRRRILVESLALSPNND